MLSEKRKYLLDSMMKEMATGWCGKDAFMYFIERYPENYGSLLPLTENDYTYIKSKMDYCEYCEYWYFKEVGIEKIKIRNEEINICGSCIDDIKQDKFIINDIELKKIIKNKKGQ